MSPTEQSARRNSDDTVLHGAEPEQSRCPGASPGAALAGGDISNTPPPSSKWVAAEDWMDIAFYVDWHADKWEALTKRLDECKTYAAMKDAPEEVTGWFAKGTRIEVDPTGARSGKGKKGIYCAWKFTWADALCFRIVNRSRIHETMPNVFVTVDGTACLTKNATDWYQDAKRLIEILGGVIRQDKLSRVDICLDMPHVPIDELVSCFDEGRYICRANAIGKLESNGKTIYFGESPIKARIYDKLREVQKKADPIKTLAMQLWRWRGSGFPDAATRVEFQIRREGLKTRGIDSVQDYLDRRASLVKYLTKEWLRLTLDHVDKENKNQSKARTLPLWQDVSDRLVEWGNSADAPLDPLPKGRADVSQLCKQGLGVFRAAARFQGKEDLTDDELLEYATERLIKMLACTKAQCER